MEANLKLKGIVEYAVFNADGSKDEARSEIVNNLIVNAGLAESVQLIGGLGGTAFSALAIGSGSTAAAATDTALQTEITTNGGARGAAAVTAQTTSVSGDTLQFIKTWNFTGSVTVNEVGIFNNNTSGGDMLGRQVTSSKSFVNGESLQITYKVVLS